MLSFGPLRDWQQPFPFVIPDRGAGWDPAPRPSALHPGQTVDRPADECPLLLPRTTGETIHRTDDWFVRRDGSMFPIEYWSAPMDGPDGRGAVVAFQDVSERRETETVLRERDAILSALGQPVYVGTPDGLITYANPAAAKALGYGDASELIGRRLPAPIEASVYFFCSEALTNVVKQPRPAPPGYGWRSRRTGARSRWATTGSAGPRPGWKPAA
jgi:PAS domain-containing protein